MKINNGFVLRRVAETYIVLPLLQKTIKFNGMLTLNESGAMLWKKLEGGCSEDDLVSALTDEYEVDEKTAREDVKKLIAKLCEAGCITL